MSPEKQRIIDKAQAGVRPMQIAADLGLPVDEVYGTISYARKRGVPISHFPAGKQGVVKLPPELRSATVTLRVDGELLACLEEPARLRGLSDRQLAVRLLDVLVREDMIDAVLDDGAGEAAGE